jgi:hypothetical protein
MHCYAKGTNCLSLKIVASLSQSPLITFLAPVCGYCSLFFLQAQFFLNNTLVVEQSKHHLSDLGFYQQNCMGFHDYIILHLKIHILGRKVKIGSYEKMPTIYYVHPRKGQEGPEER